MLQKTQRKLFQIKKLESLFEIKQIINLHPYDKDHAIVIAVFLG